MKKIVTILLMVLFGVSAYAEEIVLTPKENKETNKRGDRTEIVEVRASIEDGVINIETELATWGVTVAIYNSDGTVVYTSVSTDEGQYHAFIVGTLPVDCYTLEVQIGSYLYEGVFSL